MSFEVINGDCLVELPKLAERGTAPALVLTDPPFAEETHTGARSQYKDGSPVYYSGDLPRLINFDSFTVEQQRAAFDAIGRIARAWVVACMDWRHIYHFERRPPAGLRFVRFGVWVKPNGAPQFSGDRPATGWEGIAFLHREGGRMRWNGGGRRAVFTHNIDSSGIHRTAKPVSLARELIQLFSAPDDVVVDPFMGAGAFGVACVIEGRHYIGIEQDAERCAVAEARMRRASGEWAEMPRVVRSERVGPLFEVNQ